MTVIQDLFDTTNFEEAIGIEVPAFRNCFYACCNLLKEDITLTRDIHTGISIAGVHRAAVVASIHPENPGAIVIQPVVL